MKTKAPKTHRAKPVKSTFRKNLFKEAIERLKQENRRLKEELSEKDRIIKQKEVYIMTALEEFSKSKDKIQNHYEQKISQLNDLIAEQKKYLGIACFLCLDGLSVSGSACSNTTKDSKEKFKHRKASDEVSVFDLSKTIIKSNASSLSKFDEEDLKFTQGILDDYLYEVHSNQTSEARFGLTFRLLAEKIHLKIQVLIWVNSISDLPKCKHSTFSMILNSISIEHLMIESMQ